jgi:hypothetical protein
MLVRRLPERKRKLFTADALKDHFLVMPRVGAVFYARRSLRLRGSTIVRWAIAAAFAVLMTGEAHAHGALAFGVTGNVADDGVAVGYTANMATKARAEERALAQCREREEAPAKARALCKIYESFSRKCFAISLDPETGTPGFGWNVADREDAASAGAIAKCQEASPAARKPFCRVALAHCDEQP